MNIEIQKNNRIVNIIKWLLVILLLISAIVGNYLYRDFSFFIRILFIFIIIIISGIIVMVTDQGKLVMIFARESCAEIRKVTWPTNKETLHTTLVVAIVTIIASLVLWALDTILIKIISFFISLRF